MYLSYGVQNSFTVTNGIGNSIFRIQRYSVILSVYKVGFLSDLWALLKNSRTKSCVMHL